MDNIVVVLVLTGKGKGNGADEVAVQLFPTKEEAEIFCIENTITGKYWKTSKIVEEGEFHDTCA